MAAKARRAKNPRFEVYPWARSIQGNVTQAGRPGWGWRLYAKNGEIIAQGEGFTSERDALRAVEAVKRAVSSVMAYEVDR